MEDPIGIDVSKDNLDAYRLSKGEHKQFGNDKAEVKALALWAKKARVSRVIFESTGIYHRRVETGLADYSISFARVNPRQHGVFAKGPASWQKQTG
jgi:transposase